MKVVKKIAKELYVKEIIKSSVEATDIDVVVPFKATYEIAVVGGGGGATLQWTDKYGIWHAGGGGGATFVGQVNLEPGTYTVTIGKGGLGYCKDSYGAITCEDGTESNFSFQGTALITANGGTGGHSQGSGSTRPGLGGALVIDDSLDIVSSKISSNGEDAINAGQGTSLGGSPKYLNYGGGGMSSGTSYADPHPPRGNGTSGYVHILFKSEEPFEGYDYIESGISYVANKATVRKYYKRVSVPWSQPLLSRDGVLEVNDFATTASTISGSYNPWHLFDGDRTSASSIWTATERNGWVTFYNRTPLNVTNLRVTNHNNGASVQTPTEGYVWGSNDNIEWTKLTTWTNDNVANSGVWDIDLSDNTEFYNYYKWDITQNIGTQTIVVCELDITATQLVTQPGTPDDYDYYEDRIVHRFINL